jgi:hypothetical protein
VGVITVLHDWVMHVLATCFGEKQRVVLSRRQDTATGFHTPHNHKVLNSRIIRQSFLNMKDMPSPL